MRILLYSNSIRGRYGYSNVFGEVAKALVKAGHTVCYFGMQDIGPPWKDSNGIIRLGLRYDGFGSDVLEHILRIYRIEMLLTGFDIWIPQAQYIPNVCKKLGVKLISHITANSYPLSPFLAQFCSQADFLVAPSKFVLSTLSEVFQNDLYYIPHFIDSNTYKPLPDSIKEETKKRLRIEDKKFVVLSVQRNKGAQKDYPALFSAWRILLNTIPELKKDAVLLILADYMEPQGMRLDMIRQRVQQEENVKFIYFKPTEDLKSIEMTYEGDPKGMLHTANYNLSAEEMCRLFNIADVHVLSSSGESFGLPTLEAMACGTPVIAGNNTTGPELVGESAAGLIASIQANVTTPLISDIRYVDPNSLAKCIERMYFDKELRKKCSQNALKFAKNYEWGKITERWCDLVGAVPYLK